MVRNVRCLTPHKRPASTAIKSTAAMIDTMIIQGSTPPPVVVGGDPEGGWWELAKEGLHAFEPAVKASI